MSRNVEHTVTALPILVDANRLTDADGLVHFYPAPNADIRSVPVRVATVDEIRKKLSGDAPACGLLIGLSGLHTQDPMLFEKYFEQVRQWLDVPMKHVKISWTISANKTTRAAQIRMIYAQLLNRMLLNARWVVWSDRRQQPFSGLYCPDWRTAAFAKLSMGQFRVCPKQGCEKLFTPRIPSQWYCTPAHRDAHRMARKRWNDKVRAS